MGGHGLVSCGSGHGHVAGCCEYSTECFGSVKCTEFLD